MTLRARYIELLKLRIAVLDAMLKLLKEGPHVEPK